MQFLQLTEAPPQALRMHTHETLIQSKTNNNTSYALESHTLNEVLPAAKKRSQGMGRTNGMDIRVCGVLCVPIQTISFSSIL